MERTLAFAAAVAVSLPALAAPPVPDPRMEQAFNTFAVADIQRSVSFERTLPPPLERPRPVVNEQDMKRLGDGLYVERSLLPRGGREAEEPGVIRVFPRERR
jgi:hypothetical protein